MPATSRRERIAKLRRQLLSPERWVDALLVVEDHNGVELFRAGGCWDTQAKRYVDRPCKPHVIRLQESQCVDGETLKPPGLGHGFAEWLEKARRGEKRARSIIGGGNRGSGKTWFLAGVALVAMALEYPGDWQFGINITAKQKRECLEAIREVARPEWIAGDVADFRDPRTVFITGNTVSWLSAQNPRAIRQAGLRIRYVLINEGQDQPEAVSVNAIAAIRNTGGLVGIATNPPQVERSDWIASWWTGIEAGELNGKRFLLNNKLNRAIDQDALGDIAAFLYATNREAGDADAAGIFRLSGPIAYPAFKPLPLERGGHIGEPPQVGWTDVTKELTGNATDSGVGFDFVIGVDWQKTPGVCGQLAKLYRDQRNEIVLYVLRTIAVRGVEADFSQAMYAAGFATTPGTAQASVLVVGDATGARQNAEHKFGQPVSFTVMRNDGWKVVPPMKHWKHGTPWNPLVRDSRAQLHLLFERNQILLGPECREPVEGFSSLVESLRRAKVGPKGGLVEKGGYQHGPDGVRYLAWKFLPRPTPPKPQGGLDMEAFNALRGVKLGFGR